MLMLNAKQELSALQLSRAQDVNENTVLRIAMQIRRAWHHSTGWTAQPSDRHRKGNRPDDDKQDNLTAKAIFKEKMKGRHMQALHAGACW